MFPEREFFFFFFERWKVFKKTENSLNVYIYSNPLLVCTSLSRLPDFSRATKTPPSEKQKTASMVSVFRLARTLQSCRTIASAKTLNPSPFRSQSPRFQLAPPLCDRTFHTSLRFLVCAILHLIGDYLGGREFL